MASVAREVHADALQDSLLPVERQGILVFRDGDVRQQPRGRQALRDRLGWQWGGLDAPATRTGIGLADMAQYPDRGRDDIELFGDDITDRRKHCTVMGAAALGLREFVDHVDAGERLGQGLASTWLPGVGGDGHRRTGFSRDNVRVRTPIHLRSLNRRIWSGEHCSLLAA